MKTYDDMKEELDSLAMVLEKYLRVSKMPHDFGVGEPLYSSEIHMIYSIVEDDGISVTTLAKRYGSTKGAVSQVLKKLEAKGLITRRPDPEKRSRVLVSATEKGQTAHRNHLAFHARHDAPFINYLGELDDDAFRFFGSLCEVMNRWMDSYLERSKISNPTKE